MSSKVIQEITPYYIDGAVMQFGKKWPVKFNRTKVTGFGAWMEVHIGGFPVRYNAGRMIHTHEVWQRYEDGTQEKLY